MTDTAYRSEHFLGWLMGVASIALVAIGALVAFDVFSLRSVDVSGTSVNGAGVDQPANQAFQDGMLLILPGIAAAFLALTLHMSEHHTWVRDRVERGLWMAEHTGAYMAAIAAIAFAVIGIFVGFDIFDEGYSALDGIVWGLLSITSGVLSTALHAVGHHQAVGEEEDIGRLVEDRVGEALRRAGSSLYGERGVERR
jgi:hypothetical protein